HYTLDTLSRPPEKSADPKTMTAQQENDTPQTNLPGHTAFKIHLSLQTSVNVVKIFRRTVFFY
ncbi:hypothetical protein, partial [Prevotella sp. MGM1]|uniref:hypothetical protein n=1 Tax=Prevotella sp. MGM1 TaxID=2033405 RepID=UPI000D0BFB1B